MGRVRGLTAAQLRQQERDQHAPAFVDWLAGMDTGLERFFGDDAPEVGDLYNPWTAEGLKLAEVVARRTLRPPADLETPDNVARIDRYVRFIGEVHRRYFNGRWMNIPVNAPVNQAVEFWPVVSTPAFAPYIDPHQQLGMGVSRKDRVEPKHPDGEMVWVFNNSLECHRAWDEAGRPDKSIWREMWLDRVLGV